MIHLAAVDFDTPQILAASRTEPPGTTTVAFAFRGLPRRVPCALGAIGKSVRAQEVVWRFDDLRFNTPLPAVEKLGSIELVRALDMKVE